MKKSVEGYLNSKLLRSCRDSFKDEENELSQPTRHSGHMSHENFQPRRVVNVKGSEIGNQDGQLLLILAEIVSEVKRTVERNRVLSNEKELESFRGKVESPDLLSYLHSVSSRLCVSNAELRSRLLTVQDSLCSEYETQIQKLEAESREHIKVENFLCNSGSTTAEIVCRDTHISRRRIREEQLE